MTQVSTASETVTSVATHSAEQTAKTVMPHVPNSQDQLLEVTIALLGILALIYGVAWLLKRNRGLLPSAGIPMKTLGMLPMGVKEKVVLVEVGGKQILLGMTASSINTLATFDEPIVSAHSSEETPFAQKLKSFLNPQQSVTGSKSESGTSNHPERSSQKSKDD